MTQISTKMQSVFVGNIFGIKKSDKKIGYGKIYWNCKNEHYVISDDNIMYIIQKNDKINDKINNKMNNKIENNNCKVNTTYLFFNKTQLTYDEWNSKYNNVMFIGYMNINKYVLFLNDLYIKTVQ